MQQARLHASPAWLPQHARLVWLQGVYACWQVQNYQCLQAQNGKIYAVGLMAMWPYHLGLRGKLWLQRRTSSEPHWTEVMEGW